MTVLPVDDAAPAHVSPADLLLVGAPTPSLGRGRASTRRDGRTADRPPTGVREWLAELSLSPAPFGSQAAAFTTRPSSRFAGSAARGIARGLRRAGYQVLAPPEGFVVQATTGPLRDGEHDRARAWARCLVIRSAPRRN